MADAQNSGGSTQTTATSTEATATTAAASTESTQTADAAATAAAATAAAANGNQEAGKTTAEKVVPEKYEYKFDGDVKMDSEIEGQLSGLAKELKLSQDEAQKIANLGPKLAAKWAERQQADVKTAIEGWATETRNDPELGGEKLSENLSVAKKAVDTYGTPALKQLLDQSGLGNHPEVIRAWVKIGRTLAQDTHVQSADRGTSSDALSKLYPNHPKSL